MTKKIILVILLIVFTAGTVSFVLISNVVKERGTFYTLQKAYDEGLIDVETLKLIAKYHNARNDEGETIVRPKVPESLKEYTKRLIIETEVYRYRKEMPLGDNKIKRRDVKIVAYYGTYNGCSAVILNNFSLTTSDISHIKQEVAGINFWYYGSSTQPRIMIWKQK